MDVPWGFDRNFSIVVLEPDPNGGPPVEKMAVGRTPFPNLLLSYRRSYTPGTATEGVWQIDLSTLKAPRVVGGAGKIEWAPGFTSANRFWNKMLAHEQTHYNFIYVSGPGLSYWTEASLKAVLNACTKDGKCTVVAAKTDWKALDCVVNEVFKKWLNDEKDRWYREINQQSEQEAYSVSDQISPRYLYQEKCAR